MDSDNRSTEWALLFPLKAGLIGMKCSTKFVEKKLKRDSEEFSKCSRSNMRRGSSMSDIDKLAPNRLPDVVRSTTNKNHFLSPSSLPQTPHLSRSHLSATRIGERTERAESIGDLMNQKKYGSSNWSVRSETLVARTVPLSTVTPKQSPPEPTAMLDDSFSDLTMFDNEQCGPLTVAQRTQRLSKLIKQQRNYAAAKNMLVCSINLC
ncbi:hypothetical protein Trydic_g12768 [Trypoxylus dichotomus]